MNKILSVLIIALLLNGCRYINTKEAYVDAQQAPKLIIPEGLDEPNASSSLEVPEVNSKGVISRDVNIVPPDMPIRTQQSDDSKKSIKNRDGFAILSVKTEKAKAWKTMSQISLENWSVIQSDEESCSVGVHYDDVDARARENANFIKKIFTRDKYYTDYTGDFILSCKQVGRVIEIKLAKKDGAAVKSFLADSLMTKLYGQF